MSRLAVMAQWAGRDVLRRPVEALLVGAALTGLIWVAGTALLLTEAVRHTAHRLIDAGPSLVVRRLGPAGFAPMPTAATSSVAAVPGALEVRTRVWGPVRAGGRAAEIVGLPEAGAPGLVPALKGPEFAIVGPGFAPERGAVMSVVGPGGEASVELQAALPETAGLVAQDTFVVTPQLARTVLGLPDDAATDLVLDVFRPAEEAAIRADIAAALPFPVVITTRAEAKRRYASSLTRRGGLFLVLLIPAALAVGALVIGVARDRAARAREVGLLKAVGWTTVDIVRMHALRAGCVALPAVGLGWVLAAWSVFGPGVRWPGALLFGWAGPPPVLYLDTAGMGVVLLEVTVVAVVPWWIASVAPAIISGARDPWSLLSEEAG